MATIFDFSFTQTSGSIRTSFFVLPDAENMGMALEFGCYHLYKLRYTFFYIHFRFMAAIFDIPFTQTSGSIGTNLSELPDPENMGMAAGISLLSFIQTEIYVLLYPLPAHGRHL